MMHYTRTISCHAPLKAHSVRQFAGALLEIAAWPALLGRQPVLPSLLLAIVINAPTLLASIQIITLRPPLTDRRWLLIALAAWTALQAITVAYGRAAGPMSPRYFDVFAIAVLRSNITLH